MLKVPVETTHMCKFSQISTQTHKSSDGKQADARAGFHRVSVGSALTLNHSLVLITILSDIC